MPAVTVPPPPPVEGETTEQLEIMCRQEPYIAVDPYLMRLRDLAQDRVTEFNSIRDGEKRMDSLDGVVGMAPKGERQVWIMTPFMFEYGFNLSFGNGVYLGPGCTFIDVARISLGDRTMVGANCSFYTPGHPVSPEARSGLTGAEWAKEIIIGDDCWIGGSVVIVGPVKIGNGTTIGAGSVVTKDIPDRCVAVGNPCRVIKKINADGTTERVAKA